MIVVIFENLHFTE